MRPTADRVREAVFSALGNAVVGARVLDLFAGSGALGLEALSRGASSAVFVERDRVVLAVLEKNVAALGFAERARIVPGDALGLGRVLARDDQRFDIVFLDPPYEGDTLDRATEMLIERGLLVGGACVVAEHKVGQTPMVNPGLRVSWARSYGATSITMFDAIDEGDSIASREANQ